MPSLPTALSGICWAMLCMTKTVTARPSTLFPRDAQNFVGCSDTQKTKVQTALADAAALGNIAYNQMVTDRSSTAYEKAYNADNTTADGDEVNSLAITDSAPQDGNTLREMKLCPLFFTAAETANNLDSKEYNGNKRGSWCQTGQKFADFETAGHTILHEMTHLDALGASAGVPARTDASGLTSHGTDDVTGYAGDYVHAARELLTDWVNNPDEMAPAALKPYQNAENIAAAATENWFIKSCGFTDISLD
ncbi:hypothetical protein MBLNU459_g4199t2 [Dothideomycetes sp. NU459]